MLRIRTHRTLVRAGIAALAATALGLIAAGCGGDGQVVTVTTERTETRAERTPASVIRTARQGVVRLNVTACDGEGNGSGFVIAPGLVATAAHVVDGATSIELEPERGGTVQATVVGSDSGEDLALVRADGTLDARTLKFASSGDAAIGDDVIALGYPLGLPFTATRGAITGDDREVTVEGTDYSGLFQTDAAVNPGNSGGAIINSKGQVVGMVIAGGEGTEGIGFGVPASRAQSVLGAWAESPQEQPFADCGDAPSQTPDPADEPPTDTSSRTPSQAVIDDGFTSPTGNINCSEMSGGLVCTTSNDGYEVFLPEYGAPEADYTGNAASGGAILEYGYEWTSTTEAFTCNSEERGVTCRNQSGNGFFINRDSYDAF